MNPKDVAGKKQVPEVGWPLVSVVMCVYNAGRFLRPSVVSIFEQTYPNWEMVIVDDGSTDGCIDTIQDFLSDRRIRLLRQSNETKPVALNRALKDVRGEFYAVQDADDISYPTRLERQVRALLDQPDLAAVYTGYDLIINERTLAPVFHGKNAAECKKDIDDFRMPALDPTGMYRMSLVGAFGYEAELPVVEGLDYVLRVGEKMPLLVLPGCLYSYRVNPNSVTRANPERRNRLLMEVVRRACERRGVSFERWNNESAFDVDADNNLFAHFVQSCVDQLYAGARFGAIKTAIDCVRLHPLDPSYYKGLIYSVLPRGAVTTIRRKRVSARATQSSAEYPAS
jgi:glycosyltransferase involved in cell wall biosynthesis